MFIIPNSWEGGGGDRKTEGKIELLLKLIKNLSFIHFLKLGTVSDASYNNNRL